MSFDTPKSASKRETPGKSPKINTLVQGTKQKVVEQIPASVIKLRYQNKVPKEKRLKIRHSQDAVQILKTLWNQDTLELQEEFCILFVNNSNEVLGFYPHTQGGINGVMVDIRLIFMAGFRIGATQFLVCHNHPSGNTKPSEHDLKITQKLQKAGKMLDINLLDHIILTKEGYYSFGDEGNL